VPNREIVGYQYYTILMDELVDKLKKYPALKDIKFIYTFMRGGLPIAVHLSHHLGTKVLTDESNIDFSTIKSREVLIVDDIADTGATLDGFQHLFPTATLYYKPWSKVEPTFYVRKTKNWIVFPWEMLDEKPNR
jgi:hypoxanthine phosphoribosyltransferase